MTERDEPPSLLYIDERIAVVDKPSGELVHPGWARREPTTMTRLRDALGGRMYPVHRLDRPTSGVLVMARDRVAARALAGSWTAVQKRYLALVRGVFTTPRRVDHPVRKGEREGPRVRAVTVFRPLTASGRDRCTWIEARPQTGRLHQIRRHLKHLSHPIVGDVRYGDGRVNRHYRSRWGLHRLALHAATLRFVHPGSGEPMVLEAPLPGDLAEPLRALGVLEPGRGEDAPR